MSQQGPQTAQDNKKICFEKMHNPIYLELAKSLERVLCHEFPEQIKERAQSDHFINEIYNQLGEPPNYEMGHVAFGCFFLAKDLKNAPAKIASQLEKAFHVECPNNHLFEKVTGSGPYLNFFLRSQPLGNEIVVPIIRGDYFKAKLLENTPKTMIEYSQPNTHKVLHVGHMRNLCLGNALTNLLRYTGHQVISSTYPGDVGTHVAKCLWYLKKNNLTPPSEDKGSWLGEIYTKANHQLEDEKGSENEEKNRKELTLILNQLINKSGEYFKLWKETRQWSVELMEKAYQWGDVEFDRWFFESEVDGPSLEFAHELYKKGKLVKDDGAIGMDLKDDKLGFCLLIKSDGTGLYATKDIELARKKFEEFGIEKSIYVVDERQSFHFKQVFKVLNKIGFEQAKNCYHLPYDVVELPDGPMSSRKGNIIPLMELIEKMESTITERYLEKYRGDWSDQQIQSTAQIIANGAIKYGMVRIDNNRKIVFDFDEWLKLDGETGPYLQYVCARIFSLCEKMEYERIATGIEDVNWNKLCEPAEVNLILKLMNFNKVTVQSALNLKTLNLTSYLYDLGKAFNSFYVQCPIGKLDDQELKLERLHLSWAVGKVMEKGLKLLGIKAPEKM